MDSIKNSSLETTNILWQKYKHSCEDQEKSVHEKFKYFLEDPISHPNYSQELADYISYGYDLYHFAEYFNKKLEYLKFIEIMNLRQTIFKLECLRYRGYKVSTADDLSASNFFDEGSKTVISVINNILNSNVKDCISQKDFENLENILTRAVDYDSMNIKFNLSSKDEILFLNIRKILRNQLLSNQLSIYEKAFIRKIINDIQSMVKFEFPTARCVKKVSTVENQEKSIEEQGNVCNESSTESLTIESEI